MPRHRPPIFRSLAFLGIATLLSATPTEVHANIVELIKLNPAVGNAGAAREAQFHCAAQLLRASPNG